MTSPITDKTLETLRSYDTPTVCNVIELFGIRSQTKGYMDDRVRSCFDDLPPMVGFAATATYRASEANRPASAYAKLTEQIEAFARLSGPPVVVIEDLDVPSCAASFGDLMCGSYKAFGAVGLVTSGLGRDLDQVRALDFPVFASGIACSHGYPQIVEIDLPVRVGGIDVLPDDLIHADRNGVTTIPKDIAADVASACQAYAEAEAVVLDYVNHTSNPTLEGFSQKRNETKRRIDQLRERLSKVSSVV